MAQFFTSSTLIESVKRRAMIPSSQSTFKDEDFLAFANEEISLGILPSILRLREDYFLVTEDLPIKSGTNKYQIPPRAIGNKLRDVGFKDSNGNVYEMTRVGIQDISSYIGTYTTSRMHAFYIENNQIVLLPDVNDVDSGSLFVSYYMRPNELVTEDKVATITNINRTTGVVSISKVPTEFSTTIKYDLVQAKSPFVSIARDLTALSVNSTTNEITFAITDIPDNLVVGDYVNKECECIVPQIPQDLHVVLAHRVATRCLEALGDTEGLSNANKKLMEMEDKTSNLIDNRVEEAPKKIVNKYGALRSGLYRRRWKFRS